MEIETLRGGFTTPWVYHSTHDVGKQTFDVWECDHREGYKAYQITHQVNGGYIKPKGTGHYVEKEGLKNKTGIVLT